jgi:hypothetical protein
MRRPHAALWFAVVLIGCNGVLGNDNGEFVPGDPGNETAGAAGTGSDPQPSGAGGSATGGAAGGSGGAAGLPPSDVVDAGPDRDEGAAGGSRIDAAPEVSGAVDAAPDHAPSPQVDATDTGSQVADAGTPDVRTSDAADAFRCADLRGCATGFNCESGVCVAATVSCAAHKSTYPTSPDGVYWISPTGTPMRAYCDMQLQSELCTETEGDHRGRTREGSNLAYTMRSILHASANECSIWAVRGSADGYPLHEIILVAGQKLGACQALGFPGDVSIASCAYGDNPGNSNCGFPLTVLYQWGNMCSGCVLGNGDFPVYTKQGPMHSSTLMSSFDGSTQSHCAVK